MDESVPKAEAIMNRKGEDLASVLLAQLELEWEGDPCEAGAASEGRMRRLRIERQLEGASGGSEVKGWW